MLRRFEQYISEQHLFDSTQEVLLAVSGGVDSVTLCHLMSRAGFRFAVAHCNFHLRPGDCDRDEQFVRRLAERYGATFHVRHFDTSQSARRCGVSVEEQARNERYDYFSQLMSTHGYPCVCTAHHRDDAIETFFLNLLRGTGIAGLRGMLPRNDRGVVRPMLPFSRAEIEAYVQSQQLEYVTDYTNAQLDFRRNRIRQQVLPLLRDIAPAFDDNVSAAMAHLRDVELVYRASLDALRRRVVQPLGEGWSLSLEAVASLSPQRTLLYELLSPFGFSLGVVDDVLASLRRPSGRRFYSATHEMEKTRTALEIQPRRPSTPNGEPVVWDAEAVRSGQTLSLPAGRVEPWVVEKEEIENFRMPPEVALLDWDKLTFPLQWRTWQVGDRFVPFGMKGSRLLSDFFTDMHYSLRRKQRQWLLCNGDGRIVWVAGVRTDNRFRLDETSRRVLWLRFEPTSTDERVGD